MNTTRIGCLNKQQSRKMMAIDTRGATLESDDLWRMPMWHDMMAALPARVHLNLNAGSYYVMDNTLRIIYAVRMDVLERICIALDVDIGDICSFKK